MSAEHANGVADAPSSSNGSGPHDASEPAYPQAADAAMRPEVAVGAAFLGGFLLAVLLRRVRS